MTELRRALAAVVSAVMVVAVLVAADCDGKRPDADKEIAGGARKTCTFTAAASNCAGYIPDAGNVGAIVALIDRITKNGNWGRASAHTRRRTGTNGLDAEFTISAIGDSKSLPVSLAGLGAGAALIVARIDVIGSSATDVRYGISQANAKEMGGKFYIVVNGVRTPDVTPKNGGKAFADWQIYGISTTTGLLTKVGNAEPGIFRLCTDAHDDDQLERGARFDTCAGAHFVEQLVQRSAFKTALQGNSLLTVLSNTLAADPSIQAANAANVKSALRSILGDSASAAVTDAEINTLVGIMADGPDDPAWMTCGIGCCIADGR